MDSFAVRHAPFGDALLTCSIAGLAYFLRGPSAVCALFILCFHSFLLGRRRVSLLPLYVTIVCTSAYLLRHARTSDGEKGALGAVPAAAVRAALALTFAFGLFVDYFIILQFPTVPVRIAGSVACRGVAQASLLVMPGERNAPAFTMRVYYPASIVMSARPSRVPYLRDGGAVAAGVARFMRVPPMVFGWMRHIRGWSVEADVAHAPLDTDRARAAAAAAGILKTSSSPNAPLPVVLFSHGLGGSPDTNAAVIAAFVAVGAVVFAPEHADGSAAFTRVAGESRPYEPLTSHERADRKAEYTRRHGQLKTRVIELAAAGAVAAALGVLPRYHDGCVLRGTNADGLVSTSDPVWMLLAMVLGGRIESDGFLAAGHSFGGATALATGAREMLLIGAVTALDPWALPLGAPLIARGLPRTPSLALCGEGFAVWPENATAMRLMLDARFRVARAAPTPTGCLSIADSNGVTKTGRLIAGMGALFDTDTVNGAGAAAGVHSGSAIVSLRDIFHQSFSDYGLLAPRIMRLLKYIGSTRSEKDEVHLINEIIIDFWAHSRSSAGRGSAPFVPLQRRGGKDSGEMLDEALLLEHDDTLTQATDSCEGRVRSLSFLARGEVELD